jgi:hypothetical protein
MLKNTSHMERDEETTAHRRHVASTVGTGYDIILLVLDTRL